MAEKLKDYLARWRGNAWEWGTHDCCTFVADRVFDLTGVDHMAAMRGRYRTATGAARRVLAGGGLPVMFQAARDAAGAGGLPEACVVALSDGTEVGGLARDRWVHFFSPKGVISLNRTRLAVKVFD